MEDTISKAGRITILPAFLAQKIAAGEVIERPQSVIRELLDNAIDAGASSIEVSLVDGGNDSILVIDNGSGMDKENLHLCWLPHATSKISTDNDLFNIRTLGFRGEALSSIASVSHLKISTSTGASGAYLEISGGVEKSEGPYQGARGTRIEVRNLFYNLPGRKQFLKRSSTEFSMCQHVLIDKALAHPSVAFKLFNEKGLVLFLPPCIGEYALRDRYLAIYPEIVQNKSFLHELSSSFPEGTARIVVCGVERYQHDRRMIQIFVNRRRITEFSLVQAIEYGFTGFLPGGRFPIAACFLELDPARIDVNIHPAKREIKIRDMAAIHPQIVRCIQNFLRIAVHKNSLLPASSTIQNHLDLSTVSPARTPVVYDFARDSDSQHNIVAESSPSPLPHSIAAVSSSPVTLENGTKNIRYLGHIFGVFLLALVDEQLIMLDMHAAHERILFDQYRQSRKSQQLLVPLEIIPDSKESAHSLQGLQPQLSEMGITLQEKTDLTFELVAIPASFAGNTDILIRVLERSQLYGENIERVLFADLSCKSAIRDGDHIGPDRALSLIEEALHLPEQRCPHGRPIFFSLSRDELFELVGRKV